MFRVIWGSIGRMTYRIIWPALWFYLRGTARTRVVLSHDGKVLVVIPWLGNGKYHLPGGGVEAGEPAENGARRELNEELHLHSTKLKLKPIGVEPHQGRGFSYVCHYYVSNLASFPDIQNLPREIYTFAWLDPATLTTNNSNPDTLRAIYLAKLPQPL